MKTLWLMLLEKAILAILSRDSEYLKARIAYFINQDFSGADKHRLVLQEMRSVGCTLATWFLDIAIKMLHAKLAGKALEETK